MVARDKGEATGRTTGTQAETPIAVTDRSGDGGFNAPWSWHMIPETIEIADFTIERRDGRPSFRDIEPSPIRHASR